MVEFLAVTVVMLIPLLYLVVTIGQIQAAAFAAESAAQSAARAAVVAGVDRLESGGSYAAALDAADARAHAAKQIAVQDYGIQDGRAGLALSCTADPCLAPGSDVRAEVTVTVTPPGVPGFLADAGLNVALTAEASSPVDDLAGEG